MKLTNISTLKAAVMAVCLGGMFTACSDSIDLASVNESPYKTNDKVLAFLSDKYGAEQTDSLIFNVKGATDFYVNLNQAAKESQTYVVSYDAKALENYNRKHGTDIKPLPESLVTIAGEATVAKGSSKSSAVKVSYTSAAELDKNGVYALPLTVKGSKAETSAEKGEFVMLLRDITKMPNCHKDNGLQVISCMEVNDANPLYNLCFTLENSGKYFFDQVILFSGNINYNPETSEVYNYNNENVTQILNYKEKYLKPLQQKGMKVILGILGNHDRANVTNLNDKAAKAFAKELKAVCDAYNLDGVFLDDEYAKPGDYPGFVPPSTQALSRLCYEIKRIMPERLVQLYVYGGTSNAVAVDGHQPGEFIDYGIHDYGGTYDLSGNYPGLSKKGMILGSIEMARGRINNSSTYVDIKDNGYGGTMVFALSPQNLKMDWLNRVSQAFYGENVIRTGSYSKDW